MSKVTRKKLIILAVIFLGFMTVAFPRIFLRKESLIHEKTGAVYYCPMHPTYVSDRPGECPICHMKLVLKPETGKPGKGKVFYYRNPMGKPDISPVPKKDEMGMDYIPVYEGERGAGKPSHVQGYAAIQVPAEKQQLIGVRTGRVKKIMLTKPIRTVGQVAFDPELYTAQQEFLSSVQTAGQAKQGPYHEPTAQVESLVQASRMRLRLKGMSDGEIAALGKNASQDASLIFPSTGVAPVWVYAALYERDLPFVKVGTPAKIKVSSFPEHEFSGEVRALDPILNPATRSLRARIKVKKEGRLLRPEMYVDVFFQSDLGEVLAVPKEAVMLTGERAIVFVAQGNGFFEPREVKLGASGEKDYEVKEGLELGEEVVTSGNFLIDSESRLQGALEGMSSGGHVHGGA